MSVSLPPTKPPDRLSTFRAFLRDALTKSKATVGTTANRLFVGGGKEGW